VSKGFRFFLGIALLAWPAEAQQMRDLPLTISFALRTTALHSDQRADLTMASGLLPILTPGWSCAWSKMKQQLIVECFPRDEDQGVTMRVWCSDQTQSGDIAMIHLSTHNDTESNPATEVIASCYSR
jgi:hypothetical protein